MECPLQRDVHYREMSITERCPLQRDVHYMECPLQRDVHYMKCPLREDSLYFHCITLLHPTAYFHCITLLHLGLSKFRSSKDILWAWSCLEDNFCSPWKLIIYTAKEFPLSICSLMMTASRDRCSPLDCRFVHICSQCRWNQKDIQRKE